MARARDIPGIGPDTPYASVAARVLATRSQELVDHAAGVLDIADIERVHDMRVATRRLRAALEVFRPCFEKRALKEALREVKKIADALGERRDRDVSIAALQDFAGHLAAPDRPGVESLIAKLAGEQEEANDRLAPFVAEDRLERLRARLEELIVAADGLVAPAPSSHRNGELPEDLA